jgi:hypothetical protein
MATIAHDTIRFQNIDYASKYSLLFESTSYFLAKEQS